MSTYTLHLGDCLEVMPGIPVGSVDAIIADWPYGTTACKWDSVIPLEPLWKECKRVIKRNGAIVLTASQPFTSVLVMSNLDWFKWEDVWRKSLPTGHLDCRRRPLRQHESIMVFCEGSPMYNPQLSIKANPSARKKYAAAGAYGKFNETAERTIDKGLSYPRSVVDFPTAYHERQAGLHPTQKPVALMEYLIKTYTNPGDLVLDNTFGSCSTGEACLRVGRRFIGIEKDKGYFEIGQERMERVEEELRQAQIAKERQPYLMAEVTL